MIQYRILKSTNIQIKYTTYYVQKFRTFLFWHWWDNIHKWNGNYNDNTYSSLKSAQERLEFLLTGKPEVIEEVIEWNYTRKEN